MVDEKKITVEKDEILIFLDIDGVLVTWDSLLENKNATRERDIFDKKCTSIFNDIIMLSSKKCKIIISSSWRIGRRIEELQNIFTKNNVSILPFSKTGSSKTGQRGKEILTWLSDNNLSHVNTNFLVIDDEICDITPFIDLKKIYQIRGSLKTGLIEEDKLNILKRIKEL